MLAPFGGNLEGVRAASLAYFGKEPRKLTIAEAALLVALPQAPESRRPDKYPEAARARARARARPRRGARRHQRRGSERRQARSRSRSAAAISRRSPPTPRRRRSPPIPNAHVIRLSIDARLQAKLETLAKESVERLGPKLSAAIVVIDNASRRNPRPRRRRRLSPTPRATARSTCRARRARRARR